MSVNSSSQRRYWTYRVTLGRIGDIHGGARICVGGDSTRPASQDVKWVTVQMVRVVNEGVQIVDLKLRIERSVMRGNICFTTYHNVSPSTTREDVVSNDTRIDGSAGLEREKERLIYVLRTWRVSRQF